ncbi:MAG: hypothetical protein R2783_06295 [Gelidibacter sp.]
MNRHFKLSLTSIKVNEPLGDGVSGFTGIGTNPDDMFLCGIGINKNGERYNYAPHNIINTSSENRTFEINPPRTIFNLEIPYRENDFLFCFWFYEEDNSSLRNNWGEITTAFNYHFERKIQELRSFNYPRSEESFQAFAEIMLLMHTQVARTSDRKYLGIGDGDDVFLPFVIRASHLGGRATHIDTERFKREYNGTAEGSLISRGSSNYNLYFSYNYSKVENLVTL